MKHIQNYFKTLIDNSPLGKMHEYAQLELPYIIAYLIVRVHYFVFLYISIALFPRWESVLPDPTTVITYIPPVAWVSWVGASTGLLLIRTTFIVVSLLAALIPQFRWVRILSFIAALEFISIYYSLHLLDVDWYYWLLTAFMLIFLPNGWGNPSKLSQSDRQKFLLVFWGCQAITLLTYSMAGVGKLYTGVLQILAGESHMFEPKAAGLHIADRLIRTYRSSPFGELAVTNYYFLWPFFLGSVYLMIFSFLVAFRPRLHRIWGLGLILFHIGNFFTINIGFPAHILLNSLLFLLSPFSPAKFEWKKTILELPLIGLCIHLAQRVIKK